MIKRAAPYVILLACLPVAGCIGLRVRSRSVSGRLTPAPASAEPAAPTSQTSAALTSAGPEAESPQATLPADAPSFFDARLLTYNVLYQYAQLPNSDGSFPRWVCERYPYVVDHPELRWENRVGSVTATLEREQPDIVALNEMRGGREVALDPSTPRAVSRNAIGPDVVGDLTGWLRDRAPFRYRWVSVSTLPLQSIEVDPVESRDWPGGACQPEMSSNQCAAYDPRIDYFSTRNYVAYRSDRYDEVESGAFEIPLSAASERRFAPWVRLRERASGLEIVAVAVHLDAFSGPHRVAAARRIAAFVESRAPLPTVVLGDFNTVASAQSECNCACNGRSGCTCPDELAASCEGQSTFRVLAGGSAPSLQDTLPNGTAGSVLEMRVNGPRWTAQQPCWPLDRAGEGRAHLPPIAIERVPRRVDFVFASPSLTVLDAAVVEPVVRTVVVDGETRPVHPSDHLPVRATLRVGTPPSPRTAPPDRAVVSPRAVRATPRSVPAQN